MTRKDNINFKEKLIPLVVALVFISPAFFIESQIATKTLFVILMGGTGWIVGKEIIYYRRREEEKKRRGKGLLSNIMIAIYVFIYILLYVIINGLNNFESFNTNLLNHILWITIFTYYFLYGGLIEMRERRSSWCIPKVKRKYSYYIWID